MANCAPRLAVAAVVTAAAALPCLAAPDGIDDAMRAGDLICEFNSGYTRVTLADVKRGRPPAELLLVYEAIDPQTGRAHVVSTRSPGRKPVSARKTDLAVHLIENVNASVMVTTLTKCEGWRVKNGVETCVRFAARHAWHFDTTVHKDPDASFERQPRGAYSGFCEYWNVN